MNSLTLIIILLQFYLPVCIFADPSPAKTITHQRSECIIESSQGEYPFYKVKHKGNVIYAPQSDGIAKAVFSPNGKYIAFSGSEISGVDIEPGIYDYSVVILECSTGALKGFAKGFPNPDLIWETHDKLRFTDAFSGKVVEIKVSLSFR